MKIQFVEHNDQRQYAIVPVELYAELLEKAEMLDGIKAVDESPLVQNEKLMPSLLVAGKSKLRIWREYRGLTQTDIAKQVGVSQSTIALMESGKRAATLAMFKKIAKALNLDLDDFI
jgi:DNA-binding XRE family transcriptional regulator